MAKILKFANMPNDSSYYKTFDTSIYQLLNENSIKDKPVILLVNPKRDEDENVFHLPKEVVFTSIIVPVCAFLLGLLITRFRERWKEIRKAKLYEEYFITWVELICERVKKQSESIKMFATEMAHVDKRPNYDTFNFHIDKIKEVSSVDLHNALVLSKKGNRKELEKLYFKALNTLEFFQRKYTECLEFVNKYFEEEKRVTKEWALGLQELNNLRLKFITAKIRDLTGDSFLLEFYKIHETFRQREETKKTLFQYYIEPINQLCNKYLNETPDDQRVLDVTNLTNKLMLSYKQYESISGKNSLLFMQRHHQLEKSLNELSETITSLKKKKFKSVLL